VPYALEPLVAGELGPETVLDRSTHPPQVDRLQFVLDTPTTADLIESFPVYLVSRQLADQLTAAGLVGFRFDDVEVLASDGYADAHGDAPHKEYRWLRPDPGARGADVWIGDDLGLCVSDRMMTVLERADLRGCDIEALG
jgi:hypothetical protein